MARKGLWRKGGRLCIEGSSFPYRIFLDELSELSVSIAKAMTSDRQPVFFVPLWRTSSLVLKRLVFFVWPKQAHCKCCTEDTAPGIARRLHLFQLYF